MLTEANLVQPVPRRVRALAGDRTVIDTLAARYVWEHSWYPQFYLPPDAVPGDIVDDEGRTDESDQGPVDLHTLVLDGVRTAGGARRLADDSVLYGMAGWWRLRWDAFDEWFEEDEALLGHPRSPYVRVDSLPSSRTVRIEVEGTVLAESDHPVLLFETGLPTRHYLPSEDVRLDLLTPIDLRTSCPYKGTVTDYWDVTVSDTTVEQVAWCYGDPVREAQPVAGHVAFLDEKVDVFVDGKLQDRPQTQAG
jgi:uncharacterized protein (DUF427 family)